MKFKFGSQIHQCFLVLSSFIATSLYSQESTEWVGKDIPIPFDNPIHNMLCKHLIEDFAALDAVNASVAITGEKISESQIAWLLTNLESTQDPQLSLNDFMTESGPIVDLAEAEYLQINFGNRSGRIGSPADIEGRLESLRRRGPPHWRDLPQFEHDRGQRDVLQMRTHRELAIGTGLMDLFRVNDSGSDDGIGIRNLEFSHLVWFRGEPAHYVGTGIIGFLTPVRVQLSRQTGDTFIIGHPKTETQEWISYDLDNVAPPEHPGLNDNPLLDYLGYWSPSEGYNLRVPKANIPDSVLDTRASFEIPHVAKDSSVHKKTNFWRLKFRQAGNPAFPNDTAGYLADSDFDGFRSIKRFSPLGRNLPDGFATTAFILEQGARLNQLPSIETTFHSYVSSSADGGPDRGLIRAELESYLATLQEIGWGTTVLEGMQSIHEHIDGLRSLEPLSPGLPGRSARYSLTEFLDAHDRRDVISTFMKEHIKYAIGSSMIQNVEGVPNRMIRLYLYFDHQKVLRILLRYPIENR